MDSPDIIALFIEIINDLRYVGTCEGPALANNVVLLADAIRAQDTPDYPSGTYEPSVCDCGYVHSRDEADGGHECGF